MKFDLNPYVSVGPLRFGMTEHDVRLAIGMPIRESHTAEGDLKYIYPEAVLIISPNFGLAEIIIDRVASLLVGGVDVFRQSRPLRYLATLDPNPMEYVGVLFFPSLGLTTLKSYSDGMDTVTAMAKGRMDGLLPKFSSYCNID